MGPPKLIQGHLAALFTVTFWGTTFIFTKVLLVSFSPVEIMFYRLLLSALALSIVAPPRLDRVKLDRNALRDEWRTMAAGLCGVTLYFMFQNIALSYTLTANVSVLVSVAPLFTALVSNLVLNEKLKANFFFGFIVAMAGIILIAFNGSFVLKLNPLGDLLSILAALSWAFYSVLIKQINAQQSAMLALLAVTRKMIFYGLLFMLPLLPLFAVRLRLERLVELPNLLNLLFLGLGGSALCYVTWNYAVNLLGPVKTSVYIYMVPVVTIIVSLLVLHETITPVAAIGMALILSGMALSERERRAKVLA